MYRDAVCLARAGADVYRRHERLSAVRADYGTGGAGVRGRERRVRAVRVERKRVHGGADEYIEPEGDGAGLVDRRFEQWQRPDKPRQRERARGGHGLWRVGRGNQRDDRVGRRKLGCAQRRVGGGMVGRDGNNRAARGRVGDDDHAFGADGRDCRHDRKHDLQLRVRRDRFQARLHGGERGRECDQRPVGALQYRFRAREMS